MKAIFNGRTIAESDETVGRLWPWIGKIRHHVGFWQDVERRA